MCCSRWWSSAIARSETIGSAICWCKALGCRSRSPCQSPGRSRFSPSPVVRAWTGPDLIAAADVLQVLAVAVVVRVGSATAGMVLQGGGAHRLLAGSNLVAAAINLLLSVALVDATVCPASPSPRCSRSRFAPSSFSSPGVRASRPLRSSVLRERRLACAVARRHRPWRTGVTRTERGRRSRGVS